MSRVIDKNQTWYQEVAPRSYYNEEDLERTIIQNLRRIFPQFEPFPFKKNLQNLKTTLFNRPDLAMVRLDYSEWYVIEVELGSHSIKHVRQQIETFRYCNYTEEHADYMHLQCPKLNSGKLKEMISKVLPELMVIVNEPKPEWVDDLQDLRCKTCVFQIYKDFDGHYLFRLDGEHPYIYTHFCLCVYQKYGSPYTIKVLETDFLDKYEIRDGDNVDIEFNGLTFRWTRQNDSKQVFLHCNHMVPPLDSMTERYRLNYNDKLNTFSFTKD